MEESKRRVGSDLELMDGWWAKDGDGDTGGGCSSQVSNPKYGQNG